MSQGVKGMQWEYNKTNFDRNQAVVIGIDRYKNDSIHDLSTPVSDARALADLLETEYEYKSENVIRLFDEAATLTGLQTLLDDILPHQLNPTKNDRLIFYFAGHGIPRNSKEGPEGYLVPQDADWQKEDSFLPMSKVYEDLRKLECHHLLVILDCCFAGTFRWAGRRKMIPILETLRREHYDRFIRYPAWQVITSAAHDQEALDVAKLAEDKRGTVRDQKQELHSPFALALLEGLLENKADLIPDRVITAHELFLYLEKRVSEMSRERQKPGIYPMRLEYDRGEFVFTKPGFTSSQLKPAPPLNQENNPYRGLKPFDEKHSRFFFGRNTLVEELSDRLSQPHRSLTVVLGASGCGKSSLVKAGLIPHLRQESIPEIFALNLIKACILTAAILAAFPQFPLKLLPIYYVQQWYILEPIRPERSPFTALARAILPIVQPELIEQLSQVSFLDEAFKPKDESGQNHGDEPTYPGFFKLAESWHSATPEAKLLLVEDYFKQLLARCRNPQEKEQLSQLYQAIFARIESLIYRLQNEPQHLNNVIIKWSETHPNAKLLLTIDQFEELITMSYEGQTETHGGDRQNSDRAVESQPWLPFLQVLRGAIVECSQQLHIVLTLRSDFEPRFLSSPLSAYWKDARFPVRAMNLDELRQAIEGPALKLALYFEPPELVGKLIDEVGQMPGALPLLSFTLSELYIKLHNRWTKDNATDRALRIKDYEELGGVAGALTRRATQEYDNLIKDFGAEAGKAYQTTMRRVMLRMVTIEAGGVARRRVSESELVYPDAVENKRVAQVSDRLVKARLLVKGQETGEPYMEPAHDFLVRGWDKLQGWIEEEQGNLTLQQRLTSAANDWVKNNRSADYLWDDNPYLPLLKTVADSDQNWLNKVEAEFVASSSLENEKQLRRLTLRAKAAESRLLLPLIPVQGLVTAIEATGLAIPGFETEEVFSNVQTSLNEAVEKSREKNVFIGHQNAVNSVAISQDGQLIVSGSSDKTVRLWDGQGTAIAPPFTGHEKEVYCVAISPNAEIIASGSADGTVRLWDLKGNLIALPFKHESGYSVLAVAFSPNGQVIASAGWDSSIGLWDLEGNLIAPPIKYGHPFTSVAFSPDGQTIASGSSNGTVLLWNLQGELINQSLGGHESSVRSVAFSPDGSTIVSGGEDNTVRLWDLQGNSIGQPFKGHHSWVNSVAFSPDGQMIVSGSNDKSVRLWDLQGNLIGQPFRGHTSIVTSVAFTPDGSTIVSGGGSEYISPDVPSYISTDYTVRLWDIQSNLIALTIEHQGNVDSVAISPDGKAIASGISSDNSTVHTVMLWDSQGNLITAPFEGHTGPIGSVTFSPDGKVILSASADGTLRLWDRSGKPIAPPMTHGDFVFCAVFSPNGQMIASGSIDQTWRLWNIQGQPLTPPFTGHDSEVNSIAFSPDSQMIVTGSGSFSDLDHTVRLWDLQGNQIASFRGHSGPVNCVTFSPDGQMVISGSYDKTVRLWDLQGNLIAPPFLHEDGVRAIAFSPDGHTIASGTGGIFAGPNTAVYLWDKRGNLIGQPIRHSGSVESVAFSQDGQIIVSSSEQTVQLWRVGWLEWLKVACDRLRYHPVFKNPQTKIEKQAGETCQKYVWIQEDTSILPRYQSENQI
jgi:WD40 repeat protein/energy-coupling factor transporter ATP-binding protein EcfA2